MAITSSVDFYIKIMKYFVITMLAYHSQQQRNKM